MKSWTFAALAAATMSSTLAPSTRVGDVLGDAGGEEQRLLQHDRELGAQVGEPVVAQVDAVEQDPALRGVVEAGEQADERRLSRAGRPGDADPGPRGDVKGDVAQDAAVAVVGERDVLEADVARRPGQGPGIRPLPHVRLLVEQREGALGAREVLLELAGPLAQRSDGRVQLRHVGHDEDEIAHGDRARLHVARADVEHGRRPRGDDHADEEGELARRELVPDPRPHAFAEVVRRTCRSSWSSRPKARTTRAAPSAS